MDEGNNWINLSWGPLSLISPAGTTLGNYSPAAGSPAIDYIPSSAGAPYTLAPLTDFFGNTRKAGGNAVDVGAVEVGASGNGGGGGGSTIPTLSVLDNFDRANANTLNNGTNWSQLVALGNAGIRVNNNQAFCINTGLPAVLCLPQGNAIWNSPAAGFGTKQAAAFTFASAPVSGTALVLKGSGGLCDLARRTSFGFGIRVVEWMWPRPRTRMTFTNRPGPAGFTTGFVSGDTLTAQAEANGTVSVWKTSGTTTTFLGSVSIPTSGPGAWTQGTGGGRIGMQLPAGARVDNFAGGTVP